MYGYNVQSRLARETSSYKSTPPLWEDGSTSLSNHSFVLLTIYQSQKPLFVKMESTKEMTGMHPLDVSFDDDSSSDEQYHTHHSIQFENDQYEDQGGQKRSIKKWTEEEVSKLVVLCPIWLFLHFCLIQIHFRR